MRRVFVPRDPASRRHSVERPGTSVGTLAPALDATVCHPPVPVAVSRGH